MTSGYCAYVQKFIDSKVNAKFAHTRERHKHSTFSLGLGDGWLEFPAPQRLLAVLPWPLALAMSLLTRKVGMPSFSRIFGICASLLMMWLTKLY
jgi:hypothetical protein